LKIEESLWGKEAEIMEFFRREFVTYHGKQVLRTTPAEIVAAQDRKTIELHAKTFDRIPYGGEILWPGRPPYCGDCSAGVGQLHTDSCDVEECPRCFHQLITCGCTWGDGRAESQLEGRDVVEARYAEMLRREEEEKERRTQAFFTWPTFDT
jgi:hypothetical protein